MMTDDPHMGEPSERVTNTLCPLHTVQSLEIKCLPGFAGKEAAGTFGSGTVSGP